MSNDPSSADPILKTEELVPTLPPALSVPAVAEVAEAVPTAAAVAVAAPAEATGQEIQGISTVKLLEPVQRETPKLGRKNGVANLTAAQKLDILNELETAVGAPVGVLANGEVAANEGDATAASSIATVTKLAAQYNISRQSIYRWKKEMPRLLEQAKEAAQQDGGDGMAAALASVTRKRGHEETAAGADGAAVVKKATGEEYTAQQKLAMVRQLKAQASAKDGHKLRVREFASKHGVNYRTLYRWIKSEARLIELVEGEGLGNYKRTKFDGHLDRIKDALKVFVAHYVKSDEDGDGEDKAKKITGRIIAEKAIHIKEEMLAQNETKPFLTAEEVKAMKEFTGSQSWGRKMCRRYGWGNSSETGTPKKGDAEDLFEDIEVPDFNDGGEPVDMEETDDPDKMKAQIKKLKAEVHFYKIKTGKIQKKLAKAGLDNKLLRKQIETLRSDDSAPALSVPPPIPAPAIETETTAEATV